MDPRNTLQMNTRWEKKMNMRWYVLNEKIKDLQHMIMKFVAIAIPLMKLDICSLELRYVRWSHNKWDL